MFSTSINNTAFSVAAGIHNYQKAAPLIYITLFLWLCFLLNILVSTEKFQSVYDDVAHKLDELSKQKRFVPLWVLGFFFKVFDSKNSAIIVSDRFISIPIVSDSFWASSPFRNTRKIWIFWKSTPILKKILRNFDSRDCFLSVLGLFELYRYLYWAKTRDEQTKLLKISIFSKM